MKYRPDIDGLRALAISLVLIYHGGLPFFPSGFVGVDVFFVISGFLITTIIYNSLNNHSFSFLDFYNRRLWRLQPVFICLLILTTLLTLLFYLPDDLIQFSRSARKTSLLISNLFFSQTTTGYFSPNVQQLPLLHTWSLSIEWQCYFILPIVLFALYHSMPKQYLYPVTYTLTVIFYLISIKNAHFAPAQTYYQFSSRIFEFLIGSSVASLSGKTLSANKYLLNILGLLALSSIFYIASLDHILLGYPNGYTLVVCLATGWLIAMGTSFPSQSMTQWLSFKPFVRVGMLSYSLYIWHWMIFSLLRYQSIKETPVVLMGAYGVTFILGYLSWKYIEIPSKQFKHMPFRYTFVSLLIIPIALTHISSYLIKTYSGFPHRFSIELVNVYQQLEQYQSKQRPLCIGDNHVDIHQMCQIGAKSSSHKTGFMIGDSFSNHYWGFIDTLGQQADISVLVQGTSSCLTLPGIYLYDWGNYKNQIYQECYEQTRKYYQMIQDNHYDYVILGQFWGNYLSEKIITQAGDQQSIELAKKRLTVALDSALTLIIQSGAKPVIIKTTALMQENFHDCFFKHIKLRRPYHAAQCSFKLTESPSEKWFNQLFETMKLKYPELVFIDPKKIQCPQNQCKADLNGIPIYRDVGHITDYASYQFGTLYLNQYGNPFA